ncbi:lipase family protein [uncultured Microbacterium sp.]|uniref:lipase family protein n=1 Tax=uncultured Microbacterium sp. TaxID=191216 RepID=UPI00345DE219
MGTDGPNSYLVGETTGNAMLDAVRAAESLTETGASTDVVMWGHSQGGRSWRGSTRSAPEGRFLARCPLASERVGGERHGGVRHDHHRRGGVGRHGREAAAAARSAGRRARSA